MDDRTYRMLIPGTMFVFHFLGWLIADPSISLPKVLHSLDLSGAASLSILALGSSMCVVAIGYILSEVGQALKYPNPDFSLCPTQNDVLRARLRKKGIVPFTNLAALTAYTHMLLANENERMHEFLSRSWSRVLIAHTCNYANASAFAMFLVLRLMINLRDPATPFEWHSTKLNAFGAQTVCYGLFSIFIAIILFHGAKQQDCRRKAVYFSLLAVEPETNTKHYEIIHKFPSTDPERH